MEEVVEVVLENVCAREETTLGEKNAVRQMIRSMQSVPKAKETVILMEAVLEILYAGQITANIIIALPTLKMTAVQNQVGSKNLQ